MDKLKTRENVISRENEEDISSLEEYFTKLLKEKQNRRQLDESAILDKILNICKLGWGGVITSARRPIQPPSRQGDRERFHVSKYDKLVLTIDKFYSFEYVLLSNFSDSLSESDSLQLGLDLGLFGCWSCNRPMVFYVFVLHFIQQAILLYQLERKSRRVVLYHSVT